MGILLEYSCGCAIEETGFLGMGLPRIKYCAMHSAAPKMFKALTGMRKRIGFDSVTHWHTVNDPEILKMDNAIIAARGRMNERIYD